MRSVRGAHGVRPSLLASQWSAGRLGGDCSHVRASTSHGGISPSLAAGPRSGRGVRAASSLDAGSERSSGGSRSQSPSRVAARAASTEAALEKTPSVTGHPAPPRALAPVYERHGLDVGTLLGADSAGFAPQDWTHPSDPPTRSPLPRASLASASPAASDAAAVSDACVSTSPYNNPFVDAGGKPTWLAWTGVGLMSIAYADWACNCFSIPTMLPDISLDLGLNDVEGSLLTTGYTYMFAASMIPIGLLADRVNRFRMLGAGVATWSGLTFLMAGVHGFGEMLGLRVGFAVAQAVQNPISLSLVPDLFPRNKNAALAVYNSALYVGRALSYSVALMADKINTAPPAVAGAVAGAAESGWREMLRFVALPGLGIAAALCLMPENRAPGGVDSMDATSTTASTDADDAQGETFNVLSLFKSKTFVLTALGASFIDVGYYALGAFQATFYERAYDMDPSMYAPTLAVLLPIGGIIGGIGGGYIADKAASWGLSRSVTTAGSAGLAAPFLLASMLSPNALGSFIGLFFGLSLSEAWRAPAANMARSTAPAEYGSSTLSLYLCMRNVIGGLGPLGVALLAQAMDGDLQHAMVLVPAAYATSGVLFFAAEKAFEAEERDAKASLAKAA